MKKEKGEEEKLKGELIRAMYKYSIRALQSLCNIDTYAYLLEKCAPDKDFITTRYSYEEERSQQIDFDTITVVSHKQ